MFFIHKEPLCWKTIEKLVVVHDENKDSTVAFQETQYRTTYE